MSRRSSRQKGVSSDESFNRLSNEVKTKKNRKSHDSKYDEKQKLKKNTEKYDNECSTSDEKYDTKMRHKSEDRNKRRKIDKKYRTVQDYQKDTIRYSKSRINEQEREGQKSNERCYAGSRRSRSKSKEKQRYGKWYDFDKFKERRKVYEADSLNDENVINKHDFRRHDERNKNDNPDNRKRSSSKISKHKNDKTNNSFQNELHLNSSDNKTFSGDYEKTDTLKSTNDRNVLLENNKKLRNKENQDTFFHEAVKSDSKKAEEPLSKRVKIGNINMRTGGAYIPPAKLRMMQESIKDKGSEEYQRIAWEALKKSIVGMTNKVNSSNIGEIVRELFKENIIRGKGILSRAIMQAQAASPTFTRVYAGLVAIINSKFPAIGELILKRLIIQYKRGFRRNDKTVCMNAARFLAHLLNQEVAHEILILEMVTHLLENPTDDSVEIVIAALKECGKKLTSLSPRGMRAITQRVRDVLHEGNVDVRVRYMIEVFFAVQKDDFKDFETVPPELDLVEEEDKNTHLINLDDAVDAEEMINVFKFDPDYVENEEKYKSVAKEILGDSSDEDGEDGESDSEEEDEEENEETKTEEGQQILDMTETNIVCLRRKIYLTIQSSLDFEECAHKLLKLELKPGQILEMCYMILDCCAQQRTYEKFFGLLAQRFCQLNKVYVEPFTEIFENSYKTIHRLETNKLRNVAKFFAHLLYTDAISWMVLSIIKLNEEDTTSSSRIFIKILFQELCEYMGLPKLNERVKDVTLQDAFDGLFPRDHPHNTRFAINFFTSIGLGGLTDELREHLKNIPKNTPIPIKQSANSPVEKSSSDSSSSSSSTSSSSSSSSSESDSEDSTDHRKKKIQQKKK